MSGNGTFWRDFAPIGWWSLIVLLVFGLACGVIAYFAFGGTNVGAGVEAGCLTMLGVVLARGFISLLLHFAPASDTSAGKNAAGMIMLGFFFFPPFILSEIIVWCCGRRFFSSRIGLLTMASVVGAFTGFMDGGHQIHRASGLFPFPLDVTWGLTGSCNSTFVHLWNFADATYVPSPRDDSHQYTGGFRIEASAVFTQGSVMSNYKSSVFDHELLHTYQSRVWGPLFTIGYLLWMALTILPGLLVGAVVGVGADGVRIWTYENNPHEALAYLLAGSRNTKPRTADEAIMLWPTAIWVLASIPFYVHQVLFLIRAIAYGWCYGQVFRVWNFFEWIRCVTPVIVAAGNLAIWMAIAGPTAGAVIGGIVAGLGWLVWIAPLLTNPLVASLPMRLFKIILAWSSLFMPLCWPGHAFGLLAFLTAIWGGRFRFDWRTMNVCVIGGWLGRLTRRGLTLGAFSFHNPERLTTSTLLHQSG
ncbi:MAG TPA: hypothetical protein VHX44_04620, partial [Planctomycetota bacterium]|nr:hypothetical protein [Planctomycetota bacterium]